MARSKRKLQVGSPQGAGTEAPNAVFDLKHSKNPTLQDYHLRWCQLLLSSYLPEGGPWRGQQVAKRWIESFSHIRFPVLNWQGEGKGEDWKQMRQQNFNLLLQFFKKHNLQKRLCIVSLAKEMISKPKKVVKLLLIIFFLFFLFIYLN